MKAVSWERDRYVVREVDKRWSNQQYEEILDSREMVELRVGEECSYHNLSAPTGS